MYRTCMQVIGQYVPLNKAKLLEIDNRMNNVTVTDGITESAEIVVGLVI